MPQIVEGNFLPIVVRLEGREGTYYPRAVVRDSLGAAVATVDLAHIGAGSYQDFSVPFAGDFMTAQIDIYQDSGHTLIAPLYPDALAQLFISANIRKASGSTVYGKVLNQDLQGVAPGGTVLIGTVITDELSGGVSGSELQGIDLSDTLTGQKGDC
jgi:hypothetical protein